MAQKTFSKHSEYRTYSTKGAYDDGDFDSMKAELLPSKYGSLIQPGNGVPAANKEYYYEYKEDKDPKGSYDRKDLHTVEQYEFAHSPSNRYVDSGRQAITSTPHRTQNNTLQSSTRSTSSSRKGDLTQNIEELDSLLDDLQKDQERKPYKGGYSSDTMESSSFDYRSSATPVKSSGYSTLSKVDREVEWVPAPTTISREVNREVVRNQVTESHLIGGQPGIVCDKCHGPPTGQITTVTGVPMNKVTTTVKTYTYEVPADQDPASLPIPGTTSHVTSLSSTPGGPTLTSEQLLLDKQQQVFYGTSERRSTRREDNDQRTYVNTHFNNTSTPVGSPMRQSPLPAHYRETTTVVGGQPHVCPHYSHTQLSPHPPLAPHPPQPSHLDSSKTTTRTTHYTTNTVDGRYPDNSGMYPGTNSPPYAVPADHIPKNQGPNGPSVYKYTTTNYTYNSSNTGGPGGPGGAGPPPFPVDGHPRASPFPRTESPAPRNQEPPKKLDDLLADFPGHENFPPENDLRRRPNPARGPGGAINGLGVEKVMAQNQASTANEQKAMSLSKNIAGPAVYYPPGHENFARKDEAAAYQQAGGGYMKAKGAYKYEAESSSKSKSSSGAAVVPVCLPLCCAMPCVLL